MAFTGEDSPEGNFYFVLVSVLSALFLLITGCAAIGSSRQASGREEGTIIKSVPFYPQEDYQCGPSSLAAVLNYWGAAVTPQSIATDIYSRSAKGTLNADMVFYAGRRGFEALQYSGSLKDLKIKIASGYPLVVMVDNGFYFVRSGHYMVVFGYNENGVIVNSGKTQQKIIPIDVFLQTWERTGFWTLLIGKRQG